MFQTHHAGTQHEDGDRRCVESLDETLEDLGLDYLDLYLIHWPFGFQEKKLDDSEGIKQPLRLGDGSPNPIWNIKMEYLDTWRCFEKFVANGKCKSIGVSNFTEEQLQQIIDMCTIPPAVNQIEVHPYLLQPNLHSYCAEKNIRVMGYSPLGSTSSNHPQKYGVNLLSNPVIKVIAEKLGKTAAQILIKWTTQNNSNLITIPKSTTPSRIVENVSLDFEIENEDVKKINELDCGHRYFISYLKKPGNDNIWHSGVIEEGNDDDWVR
ncbi:hypothetical protein TL16_g09061 [Triparma laevis f. inornata]|uniref:NADP-dependent oxidoreductase domain-containing protein n=1 Tax=Triparma laevis f. inornata TaxID=1714386 RepID=A0A9W7EKE3_9STRA|nr:hypothetical protein TL16_g09061 [Triparma laevis f. inornata]